MNTAWPLQMRQHGAHVDVATEPEHMRSRSEVVFGAAKLAVDAKQPARTRGVTQRMQLAAPVELAVIGCRFGRPALPVAWRFLRGREVWRSALRSHLLPASALVRQGRSASESKLSTTACVGPRASAPTRTHASSVRFGRWRAYVALIIRSYLFFILTGLCLLRWIPK